MDLPQPTSRHLTPDAYLAIERAAETKSEYLDGEIVMMTGASREHNRIVANLIRTLGNQMIEQDCVVYPSDLRVRVSATGAYLYPDLVVTCGEEQYTDQQVDTLLNPRLIIEVLSHSTEARDRGRKFELYQTIDSLGEYLLVSQRPYRVEQYVRQTGNLWLYRSFQQADDVVKLATVECSLALQDVYIKV